MEVLDHLRDGLPVGASGVHAPLPGKLDAEHVLVVPQLRGRTPVRLRERLGEEALRARRLALARVARLDGPLPVELEGHRDRGARRPEPRGEELGLHVGEDAVGEASEREVTRG